jgi:transforming growth factor-beta-induced protein
MRLMRAARFLHRPTWLCPLKDLPMKKLLLALSAFAFSTFAIAGAPKADIVDTAVAAGSFTTLAAALKAADLITTLKGTGPFTVFAPTDAAFAKLPAGTVESLLKPENKAKLKDILTYHVVAGKVDAKTAMTLSEATMVNGDKAAIVVKGKAVTIDGANISATDIMTSNGVIHVIDSVMLPPEG